MKIILGGTITSAAGFRAGATRAGLKPSGGLDLGILYSEVHCIATGLFTANRIKAAPVLLCQKHLAASKARAIVVNAGCANACTGEQGMTDAEEMARLTAKKLGIAVDDILVASTGVIGKELSMNLVAKGIEKVALAEEGGHELAQAITTTDTFAKERAVALELGGKDIVVGGIAKGAGMIHPNLATLLCFLSTDAAVEADFLKRALREAVDVSFDMITIDGDTSTNDTVLLLANGLAGNATIGEGTKEAEAFGQALTEVCVYLAQCIARDGEGATKLIEVTVEGARSLDDARVAARTVAGSPLVKTAVYGSDPNWGRIVAALGRSGAEIKEAKIDLFLNNMCLMERGCPQPFDEEEASNAMKGTEVPIRVSLNLGEAKATAWGCDLTEGYVKINAEYTT